ncbi:MAG: hypothetical protein [Bacteriophage sp.]|nr:MAG: hypothetical protein [Bacteriophage sp.]
MPTFKSISKSNKPNNSIVNYAINDVNTVAIVTKDGEIIDKEDKCVKGCYVANPKYIYSGTPEDYVNDCFELQTKGILVLI